MILICSQTDIYYFGINFTSEFVLLFERANRYTQTLASPANEGRGKSWVWEQPPCSIIVKVQKNIYLHWVLLHWSCLHLLRTRIPIYRLIYAKRRIKFWDGLGLPAPLFPFRDADGFREASFTFSRFFHSSYEVSEVRWPTNVRLRIVIEFILYYFCWKHSRIDNRSSACTLLYSLDLV